MHDKFICIVRHLCVSPVCVSLLNHATTSMVDVMCQATKNVACTPSRRSYLW
jgi:hypothetical protein